MKIKLLLVFYILLLLFWEGAAGRLFAQSGTWTWMSGSNTLNSFGNFGTMGVATPTNQPPALYEACEWTDLQGRFWLYGGIQAVSSSSYVYSALWMYDPVTGLWTWVNGSNLPNQSANYGIKGVPATANTPGARSWGVATWVDNMGNLWLFGGHDAGLASFADLWNYNIASNMWTWISGSSIFNNPGVYGTKGVASSANYPASRAETNASWTDNTGNLWLFGGSPSIGFTLNDLWKYSIATNEWTWMRGSNTTGSAGNYGLQGIAALTNDPPARMVYSKWKDKNGNLWLFGGSNEVACFNDLWKYDIGINQWTWIKGSNLQNPVVPATQFCQKNSNDNPPARFEDRSCWSDTCGNFWLFAGLNNPSGSNINNDLWHYNVQNNIWTLINTNSTGNYGIINIPALTNKPPERAGALSFTEKNGNLWLFGGLNNNFSGFSYNDLWRYVIDTACAGGCATAQNILIITDTSTNAQCNGQCTGTATATPVNGTSPYMYSWNTIPVQTAQTATGLCVGSYTVTVTDANNNTATSVVVITTLNTGPTASVSSNITIQPGSSTTLTASGGGIYNWFPTTNLSCTTCNNPTATPIGTTTYCVEVTDTSGCKDTACVKVSVEIPCLNNLEALTVPNAFSPNVDGINDDFCLQGWNHCVETFEIVIYDRWGEQVFISNNPDFCWDGTYKNKIMEPQVFVYYIQSKFSNQDRSIIKKGNISLIR